MLRKWGTLVFLLLATPLLAMSQNTGKLAGLVLDAETGDPLPGASIVLAGTQVGTISDIDGNYFIIGVPVGTFDVQASFVGYQTQVVSEVEINAGYTREINFSLAPGVELDEIVVEYERPLIQKDAIGAPKVVTGEEIANLPVRSVGRVASLQGGVVSNDSDGRLFIRGGRDEQVITFVDGVKVIGSLSVPQQAIQEQEMLIGTIPAKFGDAMSGIISITTKSGSGSNLFGSFEAITSEVLDPWGYNLFSASVGGPIVQNKLSFFLSGEGLFNADASPYAVETPQLRSGLLGELLSNPQALQLHDADGNLFYIPFPSDVPEDATEDDLRALVADQIPEGSDINTFSPIDRTEVITADDFVFADEKDHKRAGYDVLGNVTYTPSSQISIRVGGGFGQDDTENYSFYRSVYQGGYFSDTDDQTWRLAGTWTHRLSGNTFYQIQGDYTQREFFTTPSGFGQNVAETLLYGDIDHPVNATLASYRSLVIPADGSDHYYEQRFEDGNVGNPANPGEAFNDPTGLWVQYAKGKDQQLRLSGNLTTQIGSHQIELGGEFEQITSRRYTSWLSGFNSLARYVCDDPAASNCGAESLTADTRNAIGDRIVLDPGFGNFESVYANLPFEAFRSRGGGNYYGYDFRGLNEVDDQNVSLWNEDCYVTEPNNPDCGSEANHNVAPWEPIYYAGYIQDKIEFRDLVINLGLRVDVFDSNTLVLRDQWAPAPIIRVSDLEGVMVPSGIGTDFAVYFDDANNIVGYRSIDGDFFDATGGDSDVTSIRRAGAQRQKGGDKLVAEIFEDYEPEVTFMPRIGVSFPVTNQALFFASYNVTSQRPREQSFAVFTSYDQLSGQARLNNSALTPEKTVQYELGFRQSLGTRAAFQVSTFLRQQKDMVQIRNVNAVGVGIGSYGNVQNVDFATTKGLEFEFDLRRTNGVALRANYTFQVANATGSDSQALRVIQWRGTLGEGAYFPNFIAPADFDRRHSANLSVDYRLGEGEGPKIGDTAFLQNFGFNVLAQIGSGMPYTALLGPFEAWASFTENVDGSLNGHRLPWYSILDLRVDRRFRIGGGTDLTAFVWVENVLDQDNTLSVFRYTGLPDEDGWLSTPAAQGFLAARAQALGDPIAASSFEDNYRGYYLGTPIGAQAGNHESQGPRYSAPRRIRLGVRLNF